METSPSAPTLSSFGDDMSKPGDGVQSEAALEEELALATKSSNVGIASELLMETSSFSSPNSGNFNDNAVEGTAVAQKKRKKRGDNWTQGETDKLLEAALKEKEKRTRKEQGTARDSYWDAVAREVPDKTGDECEGRMETLKKSFRITKNYYDGQGKEFNELNEKDFGKPKLPTQLTVAWYNHIRDHCPPRPTNKLKMNGGGSSSKSTGSASASSTSGLLLDGSAQGERALVDPPAGQLERQVVDPLPHQAPPGSPRWSDLEDLLEASFLQLPVEYNFARPVEPANAAPFLLCDSFEDLPETWPAICNKF